MAMWSKLLYNQLWNIGFCYFTPEDFLSSQALPSIKWLKHSYTDRWFADPFIYKVLDTEIIVFVEECTISKPKGIIVELVIDRLTMRLKDRYVLLEKDTHLSYPAVIEEKGKVFVYPENGQSGELYLYEYDGVNHRLINPVCILNEAVADATIMKQDQFYYLIATKYPDTQEKVYMYRSTSLTGPFVLCGNAPFTYSKNCSRPAGNWIQVRGDLYRPAQDCVARYGSAISMMRVCMREEVINEVILFSQLPVCWRYNLGIHTINFKEGFCVVDSFGYLHPIIARFIMFAIKIKHRIGI